VQPAQRVHDPASDKKHIVKSAPADLPRSSGPACPECGRRHGRVADTRRAPLIHRLVVFYRVRVYTFEPCLSGSQRVMTGEAVIGLTSKRTAFQTNHP